jgi:pimeloyl-ACP methyl ester carboxylesterase
LRNARRQRLATTECPIDVYLFEPDGGPQRGSILISHGWTSEASFMAVIAEQLRRAGFRVVAFDQPAHGRNVGVRASLVDCARALRDVTEVFAPVRFVVAHSMGCIAALMATVEGTLNPHAPPVERYVLIAGPNRFRGVTHEFARQLGLSPAAERHFERQIERVSHHRMRDFTAAKLLAASCRPALILHDREDPEVGFHNAEEIAAACPAAELRAFDGFGHRKILAAGPVIRAAITYLSDS